jgi:hypothetical protein
MSMYRRLGKPLCRAQFTFLRTVFCELIIEIFHVFHDFGIVGSDAKL